MDIVSRKWKNITINNAINSFCTHYLNVFFWKKISSLCRLILWCHSIGIHSKNVDFYYEAVNSVVSINCTLFRILAYCVHTCWKMVTIQSTFVGTTRVSPGIDPGITQVLPGHHPWNNPWHIPDYLKCCTWTIDDILPVLNSQFATLGHKNVLRW